MVSDVGLRERGRRLLRQLWESLRERMASGGRWSAMVRISSGGMERRGGVSGLDMVVEDIGLEGVGDVGGSIPVVPADR
jgi:hypothetical protein